VTAPRLKLDPQPIALTRQAAASALDVSVSTFDQHIRPELKAIRRGATVLYPVAALERWAIESAEYVLPEGDGR
jgi:hypothetical protein